MSMNDTPASDRTHIGFFGMRNAGKSSLVNAVTNQQMSVVSPIGGTTTDPVTKSMEILPLGPVVIIDTPGFDDSGDLGEKRVERTRRVLASADIAVLAVDSQKGICECDRQLIKLFSEYSIPHITVFTKCDLTGKYCSDGKNIYVSAADGTNIDLLKSKLGKMMPGSVSAPLISDKLKKGDTVILVTPIDEAAPAGRMILPQVQTLRDILDAHAIAVTVRETELEDTLKNLSVKPALVITDSQAFHEVSEIVPEDIMLTSFSILMARRKGFLEEAVKGVSQIKNLKDGDKILISEACTHHRQCSDIGTVKLPALLKKKTGKNITFETSSGKGFPDDLSEYSLIFHCGGCMITEREMLRRMKMASLLQIPVTNYGTALAYLNGILKRSLKIFPDIAEKL